jgi:hypothetical protein
MIFIYSTTECTPLFRPNNTDSMAFLGAVRGRRIIERRSSSATVAHELHRLEVLRLCTTWVVPNNSSSFVHYFDIDGESRRPSLPVTYGSQR